MIGHELLEKIRSCHANPVTRNLAARRIDRSWSSARRYESHPAALGSPIPFDRLPRGAGR